jgi:outer membrane protein OmpA-like peptidoglycan-associated protein
MQKPKGAYLFLVIDVLFLVIVLGVVLQTLTTRALGALRPPAIWAHNHWTELAAYPCVAAQHPPAIPVLAEGASVQEAIATLVSLGKVESKIWKLYSDCQEPRTEVISEDLLHFRFNAYDQFEAPPEPAYAKINGYVDQNLALRNQIYVTGHTDDIGGEDYNFALSHKRAVQIMRVIKAHLEELKKKEGEDYIIYPLGMGYSQKLKQDDGESGDDWRRRCRRIEISFRSRPRS